MALVLLEQFITSYAKPPKVIVLDVDDTEDRVHGQQEQARYDGYYGGYCFMPLHLYEGLSGRLITTILKARASKNDQKGPIVLPRIWASSPGARFGLGPHSLS